MADDTDIQVGIYTNISGKYEHFAGKAINEDDLWLLSYGHIDFENAPKTCAKALEITKNCKTDAEKITAVFNWVANNIKYDWDLYNEEQARIAAGLPASGDKFDNRERELDNILDSKKGVCEQYACLMAGMLRSLGIPCKYVSGSAYGGVTTHENGWDGHAWVAVSPDTKGLNMTALGAGHEPDGWIRLDPTWGDTASGRAKAAVDAYHIVTSYE